MAVYLIMIMNKRNRKRLIIDLRTETEMTMRKIWNYVQGLRFMY